MAKKKLVIIDGYSLLFRAFYGTRFLSTSDGRPTNALFGFVNMLFRLLERESPDSIFVALDAPGKTFRDHEYPEYKATRGETPEELKPQLLAVRDLISALNFPIYEMTGYEADDIVGTISRNAEKNGYETLIVTGDLDQLQLVDPNVTVMTTRQGVTDVVFYDPPAVRDRYGIDPSRIPDYKALVGDPSDNIPGVPGVGEKTATKLLQQFETVEDIIANLDKVEEKYRKKIEPCVEQIPKSKWLATIATNVPIDIRYEPFRVSPDGLRGAAAILESLEFRSQLKRLPAMLAPYMEKGAAPVQATLDIEERPAVDAVAAKSAAEVLKWLGDGEFSILVEGEEAAICSGGEVKTLDVISAHEVFAKKREKAFTHDAKPLMLASGTHERVAFDTMIAGYVLQSGRTEYNLADLVQGYLDEPPPRSLAERASAISRLVPEMKSRLEAEGQWYVCDSIEVPLTPVLADMEKVGIRVEQSLLADYSGELDQMMRQTASRIHSLAGEEFNIGSTQQLGKILFEKLGIPSPKKTKTGYATGADILSQLAAEYEICAEVLNWRELSKIKSTYADALPKLVGADGRIHTTYQQAVAATGRLSSADPNLQNIPIRTEIGRHIRRAFIADTGFDLASLDYSQIELRLLAHACGDPTLVDAFQTGKDVHAATASIMWNEPIENVSGAHRRYAKMLNYAVLYGVTDFGLANQLGGAFTVQEAKRLIENYFERFPKVREFMDATIAEARAKGFTTTLVGRRRYFPEIHSANRAIRQYAERQAINAPLQGGSADMIKLAMLRVRDLIRGRKSRLLLQVHDELLFELHSSEKKLVTELKEAMESALPLSVPVEVDVSVGPNWSELKN